MSTARSARRGLLAASALAATAQGSPIDGIWEPDPSRSERFPAEPPFTPEGKRIVAEWRASQDPIEDDPGAFCQAPGMPSLALGGASYPVEIIATAKWDAIIPEETWRVVYLLLNDPARRKQQGT